MSDGQRPTGAARGGGENHPPRWLPRSCMSCECRRDPPKTGRSGAKQKGGQKTKSVDPDERKESPDSGSNPRTERQKKTWGIYTRLEPTLAVRSEPARGRQSPTTWPRIRRCGSLKPVQPTAKNSSVVVTQSILRVRSLVGWFVRWFVGSFVCWSIRS